MPSGAGLAEVAAAVAAGAALSDADADCAGAADCVGLAVSVVVLVDVWLRETTATANRTIPTNTARTTRLEDFCSELFFAAVDFAGATGATGFAAGAGVVETRDTGREEPVEGTAGMTTRSTEEREGAFLVTRFATFLALFLATFFAGAFLATFLATFLAGAFLATFFATDFFATLFFATDFLATFFATAFFAAGFLATFLAADFFAVFLTATDVLLKDHEIWEF